VEIAILKKVVRNKIFIFKQHDNIVRMFEVIDDPSCDKLYIVMDYVPKGSIADKLKKTKLTEDECWIYFRDLIRAMDYCTVKIC
jgi:serine/threonine protein kinase